MQLEEANTGWREGIPACPSSVLPETGYRPEGAEAEWRDLKPVGRREGAYHPGAVYSMRSQPNEFGAGCQCIYDEQGRIVEQGDYTEVVGGAVQDRAGTMDRYSPNRTDPIGLWRHFRHDVEPYNRAGRLDRLDDYFRVRPMEVESDTQSTE